VTAQKTGCRFGSRAQALERFAQDATIVTSP